MSRMKWCWANGLPVIAGMVFLGGVVAVHAQNPTVSQEVSLAAAGSEAQIPPGSVVAIRVVTADGRVLSDCPSGVSVEIGKPLDRANVAASLRALYRAGNYSDLRAVVAPVENGVRLDFVATENLFFNRVIIEGLTAPPSDASAAAAMQINLGDIYRAALVDEGLQRLRDALREEGLYRAEVS